MGSILCNLLCLCTAWSVLRRAFKCLPSRSIWILWMKTEKVGNFHLDSPDRSISSPAVKVHPIENASLLAAVEQNAPAVSKLGHICFLGNITDLWKSAQVLKNEQLLLFNLGTLMLERAKHCFSDRECGIRPQTHCQRSNGCWLFVGFTMKKKISCKEKTINLVKCKRISTWS